jgi:hypothetical protein
MDYAKWAAAVAVTAALGVGLAACGGNGATPTEEGISGPSETAEAVGPDIDGKAWLKLSRRERIDLADRFISDNPDLCPPGDWGRTLANMTSGTYEATGHPPLATPVTEVLKEMCAASYPSG